MLVKKKMSQARLLSYIAAIIIILGVTGFVIFKNFQFTSQRNSPVIDYISNLEIPNMEKTSQTGENNVGGVRGTPGKILKVLNDQKFKDLKDNTYINPTPPLVGKTNPFEETK